MGVFFMCLIYSLYRNIILGAVSKRAEENRQASNYIAPEPEVMYYKTIPVKIVDIKNTW